MSVMSRHSGIYIVSCLQPPNDATDQWRYTSINHRSHEVENKKNKPKTISALAGLVLSVGAILVMIIWAVLVDKLVDF